jgi:hypothetical protein
LEPVTSTASIEANNVCESAKELPVKKLREFCLKLLSALPSKDSVNVLVQSLKSKPKQTKPVLKDFLTALLRLQDPLVIKAINLQVL